MIGDMSFVKYFIIYRSGKFIGYTDNKKILKRFLQIRDSKYTIVKMHADDISERIKISDVFESYSLAYYEGYKLTTELPLFIYEFSKFESLIREELITTTAIINSVLRDINYIKYDKLDEFKNALSEINNLYTELITYSYHEPIYDENFDVFKFFKYLYERKLIH